MAAFNEEFRFGSARFSRHDEIASAGLFRRKGLFLGYADGRPMFFSGDAPSITIAGAGGGKLRDKLAFDLCGIRSFRNQWTHTVRRAFVQDLRGELTALSIHGLASLGIAAYAINPYGLHGLPQHRINPWDMLVRDSNTLDADIKIQMRDLIVLSGSSHAEYFELRGQEWAEAFAKTHVFHTGGTSMPALYDIVNQCEDAGGWQQIELGMLASPYPEVHRVAKEIGNKRKDAPKEYGAIMGELYKSLSFLSDRKFYHALSGSDVSLEVLCQQDARIANIVPAEYLAFTAAAQRALISGLMIYKQRHPAAPRIYAILDECGQLGRCESVLRGYTYGRGMGLTFSTYWQDKGQIARNFGEHAISGLLGSSQVQQYFAVRDLDTARMISEMLGNETVNFDEPLDQSAARRNKARLIKRLLRGSDPFMTGINYNHEDRASRHRQKQQRPLRTPDEILRMPEDEELLFLSGKGLHPIRGNKYPYFTRPELAGAYLANPYHPPRDRVRLATRSGVRWARIVTERVPAKYAHFPQYQSGEWSYVEGYRPL